VSSWLNAARSVGERKRIAVSIEKVARRLSVWWPAEQLAHFAHDARGQRDQIARREAIGTAVGSFAAGPSALGETR